MGKSASRVSKVEDAGPVREGSISGLSIVKPRGPSTASRISSQRMSEAWTDGSAIATKYGELCPRTTIWFQMRNEKTLKIAIAFVPWIIQQAYYDGTLDQEECPVAHRGEGAVVFSDASGFTALTERLAVKSNGAELLSQCLTGFFTPLIDIINAYRGDVIKFSGDALTIYFPSFDDTTHPQYNPAIPPHGTYGLKDLGPMATAVLRASACTIEIHKRLHMFETGVDGVVLCLHIGVGCGSVTILQVGGVVPPETKMQRYEYVIAGPAIEQISIAEPLAKNGETCLSPQAWKYAAEWAIEGRNLGAEPPECDFHILEKIDPSMYTFPCVRHAAVTRDQRMERQFKLTELKYIRRYIPSNVFKQIENDTLTYVNEMRTVSTIFISGSGVDVSTDAGAQIAHELVVDVQHVCYAHEGSLNKYLVDDKGMLFLLVYGLPPMVHTDDPVRAVLACLDIIQVFKRMGLVCRCGVTTGRNYCGVVGSAKRMEYTVLGDTVNLAARLMANASENSILVDEATMKRCGKGPSTLYEDDDTLVSDGTGNAPRDMREVICKALEPIKVKGKTNLIPIFRPELPAHPTSSGINLDRSVNFPWSAVSCEYGGTSKLLDVRSWDAKKRLDTTLEGPRCKGGLLVLSGDTGVGRSELTEFTVADLLQRRGSIPIFGTQDNRPGPKFTPLQRLLTSIVSAFRYIDSSLPPEDKPALASVTDADMQDFVSSLNNDLSMPGELWYRAETEEDKSKCARSIELVQRLLRRLLKRHPVTCILSLRSGSNIFVHANSDEETVLWRLTEQLANLSEQGTEKSLLVVLAMRQTIETCPAHVAQLIQQDAYIRLSALSQDASVEYLSKYIGLPEDNISEEVAQFVARLSQGNAMFIGETIDSLLKYGHIEIVRNSDGVAQRLLKKGDLESINIAEWTGTNMIGDTLCMLESLEPLQTVVVKMATVFSGVFTVGDLAASACSRWAGATFFDAFRLFYAVTILEERGILQRADSEGGEDFLVDKVMECFRFNNSLIRKVGCTLVLESQKKTVKRQALIDRVLARSLPGRMEDLRRRKEIPHIPWYYQIDQPETLQKKIG